MGVQIFEKYTDMLVHVYAMKNGFVIHTKCVKTKRENTSLILENKFQKFVIENCENTTFIISAKILSLLCHRSSHCTIFLSHVISDVALFKCSDINVYEHAYIPINTIEECSTIDMRWLSPTTTQSILVMYSERIRRINHTGDVLFMGKLVWNAHERSIYSHEGHAMEYNTEYTFNPLDAFVMPAVATDSW